LPLITSAIPYFDELPEQHLDGKFLEAHCFGSSPIIGLLPGSRNQEVERNLSTLVRSAAMIHAARPDTRFLVACFKASHQEYVEEYLNHSAGGGAHASLPIQAYVGRTPEDHRTIPRLHRGFPARSGWNCSIAAGLPSWSIRSVELISRSANYS